MRIAVALLLAAVVATGLRWGTFAVGGSDSYCYVHQAVAWSTGRLQAVEPLALDAPWPNPPLTFAPTGHVPSPTIRGAAVPICPVGLSIVMAPFALIDGFLAGRGSQGELGARPIAIFLVVPLFGALLIGSVHVLGSRFAPRVGLASALVVACSPAFLFQLMQPMSDVPAAALWVLAAACATGSSPRASLTAGLATSAAILIRPNLLPLGVTIGVFVLLGWAGSGDESTRDMASPFRPNPNSWRDRLRHAALFAAASAPGCIAVAIIQLMLYGSPLRSGYGSFDTLFALNNIAPNAARYLAWLWQSHTPAWLLALAAPFLLPGRLTRLLLSLAVVNVACYLPYVVFNDWWYLRFLLPAIAMLLILAIAAFDALARVAAARVRAVQQGRTDGARRARIGAQWVGPLAIGALALMLSFAFIREARARSVFDLQRLESRYARAGRYVGTRLPPNALIITSWESGSVRFYTGRRTLVWDVLDAAWLDRAIAFSRTRGLEPYLLFERWEEPLFRRRFSGSVVAALDWPPAAEIAGQVRIYRPDDRARYFRGDGVPTEYSR